MTLQKPIASLSLDLDNKWSYMKTHGDRGWDTYPTYLPLVVPRILEWLDKHNLKITFFIVGKDASIEENQAVLRSIHEAGHEIGNHSFHHEPWLHLYSEDQIKDELRQAEDIITSVTGQRPRGFRGPGFSVSESVLNVLAEMDYAYDCSTLPTYLSPLARMYFFMTSKLSPEEKEQRKKLFGTFTDGLRPNKPYKWQLKNTTLVEIPVTTMPVVKVPIHASYVLYLAKIASPAVARFYFNTALGMCRMAGVEPSILLHPLDYMALDDAPELGFFPAMQAPLSEKLSVMDDIAEAMKRRYDVVTMRQHADAVLQAERRLPQIVPQFG
ncbi:MAG: polysaccharide deacetylase family protein [Chloroflexota bacterium]